MGGSVVGDVLMWAQPVAEAIALAESSADLTALPFPVRQWTRQYEAELARFLGELGD